MSANPVTLAKAFDASETRTLKVGVGDRLLLQGNAMGKRFINGELVEVKAIQGGDIVLTAGRILRKIIDPSRTVTLSLPTPRKKDGQ